eukprot:GFYU01007033.1.p1 GENE.GFYU01007033.1~~GFYU01007033.1.p1  ORF type:complete len:396 (-),score=115.59 GFYU01007033.1:162-1349(-)
MGLKKDEKPNCIVGPREPVYELTDSVMESLCALPAGKRFGQAKYPLYLYLDDPNFQLKGIEGIRVINASALKELKVSGNQLEALEEVRQFGLLKRLYAAKNLLSSFKLELYKLEHLDLSFNQLTTFPNMSVLPTLKYLNLSNNKISGSFAMFERSSPQLNFLDLSNNEFDWNQEEMFQNTSFLRYLSQLGTFSFQGNNKIHELFGYKEWILYFAPRLQYFNNEMVKDEEKRHTIAAPVFQATETWRLGMVDPMVLELYAGTPLDRERRTLEHELDTMEDELSDEEEARDEVEDLIEHQEEELAILRKAVDRLQRDPNRADDVMDDLDRKLESLALKQGTRARARTTDSSMTKAQKRKSRLQSLERWEANDDDYTDEEDDEFYSGGYRRASRESRR